MPAPDSRPRRRPSLLIQIAVALGLVGTVPLALAVWQLIIVNRDALYEQLLRTHTVSARTAADALDGQLAGRRSLLAALTADPRLLADPTASESQILLRDSLAAWSESGVIGLAVVDNQGNAAVRLRTRENAAVVDGLLSVAPPGGAARLATVAGTAWLVVSEPLASGSGNLVLIADGTAATRALDPDELGEEARLVLLDRNGAALWGGKDGSSALPPDLAAAALSGRLSGAGPFRDSSGQDIVAAWSSADSGRWIVVSMQPAAVAEAAARRMARRSAIAVAASLVLVALISIVAWRGLVRPLRALLAAQRAAGGGSQEAAPVSETAALHQALEQLEARARDRAALDEIFLGRYQVLELIGSGGMGSVFRGWDPRLQRPVALKTMQLSTGGGDDANASKLLAEAIAVAQVTHPNVVGVFDAEESQGAAFVAMELVEGIGLDRYLERRERLDWREIVPLGAALSRGLAAAHARGLVHRDIKPGNVLLGRDGGIKIADFGLATFLSKLHESPGKVFGTPGFLAPEALQGQEIDERSDLYALGVVLYRAVTGRYPFRGTSFRELVVATIREPAPQPQELEGSMPDELAALICGLLAKNPAERPAPADAVAERLEAIAHQHGLTWRLDFSGGAAASGPPSLAATMPTMRLDADLS